MKPDAEGILFPELPPVRWLTGAPPTKESLSGKPLLIDFWDSTCLPCLRTLPWIRAWHGRYADHGLAVLSVHTPEFRFENEDELVARFVAESGLAYPVGLDGDRRVWEAFHNRYWPSRYLFDATQRLRYYHFGEGNAAECETAIRDLLAERDRGVVLPAPHAWPPDEAHAQAEPEMYLGLERAHVGNDEKATAGEPHRWTLPGRRPAGRPYLDGLWRPELRYLESIGAEPASIQARVRAAGVHALLEAAGPGPAVAEVLLDGEPVPVPSQGTALSVTASGRTLVEVAGPRLYELIRDPEDRDMDVQLRVEMPGLRAYTLAFEHAPAPEPRG